MQSYKFSWFRNYEIASVKIGDRLKKNKCVEYYSFEYTKNILFTPSLRMLEGFYYFLPVRVLFCLSLF